MTISLFILAAEQLAAEETNLLEELEFLGTGLMVVLVTLMLLALITTVVGKIFERQAARSKKKAPSVILTKPEGIPEEEVAVITAAVAAAIDQSHRIAHMGPATTGEGAWALGSRLQHHTSHKPHRDKR